MRSSSNFSALIILLLLSSLSFFPSVSAQSGTNLRGVIDSNSTWTKAGSPYILTSPVAILQGVTVTVEPGTTVNLNNYYIQVNGTLSAIGSSNDKIVFNGGQITFTSISNSWDEQAGSGCIIENSIINQATISASNPIKIDNCIINSQITVFSSIISNNVVTGNIHSQTAIPSAGQSNTPVDTSVISNNNINGNIQIGSVSLGAVTAPSEACRVFNNTVYGSIISGSPQGTPQIYNNTVSKGGIGVDGYGSIFNNYIYGCQTGINLYTMRVFGGNLPCYATVQNNLVVGNSVGISLSLTEVFGGGKYTPTVRNNTISGNTVGISLSGFGYDANPTITYNNLQNSANYSFYLQESNNVDLSNNWWGTIDQQAIGQSIYDYKNDFTLGKVTFTPFLTTPNPEASSIITPVPTATPTPTSPSTTSPTPVNSTPSTVTPSPTFPNLSPTSSPNPTTSVPEFSWLTIFPLLASAMLVAVAIKRCKKITKAKLQIL